MTLKVTTANPGTISGVTTAHPSGNLSVTTAHPGRITSVIDATPGSNGFPGIAQPSKKSSPDPLDEYLKSQQAQLDSTNAYLKQLEAQMAAQPKAPYYNTTAAYATAQKKATSAQSAKYQDELNRYLAQEQAGISQEQTSTAHTKAAIDQALQDTLAGNDISKQSAQEQQANSLSDVNTNETNYQADEGSQFDSARAALPGNVANSGLTTSGLGRQQETSAIGARNQASKEQEQTFSQNRRDINQAANTTFAQLEQQNTSAQHSSTAKTQESDDALKAYIQNAGLAEKDKRASIEDERQSAIQQDTNNYYETALSNWLASQLKSGVSSQDIAAAKDLYWR